MPVIRLNVTFLCLCCIAMLSGCVMWSDWRPSSGFRDLPYSNGKIVEAKFRTRDCPMCGTGKTSETAFFDGRKEYSLKDIGEQASLLLMSIAKKEKWVSLGKSDAGNEQFFSPVRIFVPSFDPLIVMTIPWEYKTNLSHRYALDHLSRERAEFEETDHTPPMSRFLLYLPHNIGVPIELRGSLPAKATHVRVIAHDFDSTIEIPGSTNGKVSIVIGKQTLVFTRAEGKVLLSFLPH